MPKERCIDYYFSFMTGVTLRNRLEEILEEDTGSSTKLVKRLIRLLNKEGINKENPLPEGFNYDNYLLKLTEQEITLLLDCAKDEFPGGYTSELPKEMAKGLFEARRERVGNIIEELMHLKSLF